MKLVKFSCGCVGFEPDNKGISMLILSCEDGEYHLWPRDMEGKSFKYLPAIECERHRRELASLLVAGHHFQEIKRILA